MIKRIVPAPVACAEAFGDLPSAMLFSGEEAATEHLPPARRSEFRTVRHCARAALGELGLPPVPILPGPRREPRWPDGIVGSMTHCAGYRAAAVARAADIASLGIDAEPHEALPAGLLPAVARPEEITWLTRLYSRSPGVHWDRLTFSAKESVYKTWFPLTRRRLGFHDASLTIHPDRQAFDVSLHDRQLPLDGRRLTTLSGRWIVENGLITTCVAVGASWGPGPRRAPAIPAESAVVATWPS